jgi:hypothetical protein
VYGADSWVTQIPAETFTGMGLTRVQVRIIDNAGRNMLFVAESKFNFERSHSKL